MSNSELLRIKNGQKTPYKKQKTASSHKKIKLNVLMTVLGLSQISIQSLRSMKQVFLLHFLRKMGE